MPTFAMTCHKPSNRDRCCCNCVFHIEDRSHPWTNGCSIMERRGWICMPPGLGAAISGWRAHGFCELWTLRVPVPQKMP